MATNPFFRVTDTIYLIESAKRGFIESYRIDEVRQDESGTWKYKFFVPSSPPNFNATYGDRITLKYNTEFELEESEVCSYCDAVDLAYAAAQQVVAKLAILKQQCEETGGSGQTG